MSLTLARQRLQVFLYWQSWSTNLGPAFMSLWHWLRWCSVVFWFDPTCLHMDPQVTFSCVPLSDLHWGYMFTFLSPSTGDLFLLGLGTLTFHYSHCSLKQTDVTLYLGTLRSIMYGKQKRLCRLFSLSIFTIMVLKINCLWLTRKKEISKKEMDKRESHKYICWISHSNFIYDLCIFFWEVSLYLLYFFKECFGKN